MQRAPIRGVQVVLRPLEREHLARCVKWFNDPAVTSFLGRERTLTMAEEGAKAQWQLVAGSKSD